MEDRVLRDAIIQSLEKDKGFNGMTAAKIDGTYFKAADIAFPDSEGNCRQYRIAVIPHET